MDEAQVELAARQNFTIERVMAVATSYETSDPLPVVRKALSHTNFAEI